MTCYLAGEHGVLSGGNMAHAGTCGMWEEIGELETNQLNTIMEKKRTKNPFFICP